MACRTPPAFWFAVLTLAGLLSAAGAGAATVPPRIYLPLVAGRQPQQLVPSVRLSGYVGPVAAGEGRLYVAGGNGLEIRDASDPALPLLGSLALPVMPNRIDLLVPAGSTLYIITKPLPQPQQLIEPLLLAVDVGDATRPRLASSTTIPLGSGYGVRSVAFGADRLSVSTERTLLVFDLARPQTPRIAGQHTGLGGGPSAAYGRYLYVSNSEILDLSEPAAPRRVAPRLPDLFNGGGIAVVGDTLYILTAELRLIGGERCYDNRLQAYSLADPTAPVLAGFVRFPATGRDEPGQRCASFTLIGAAPGRIALRSNSLLQSVAISDPLQPLSGQTVPLGYVGDQTAAISGATLLLQTRGGLLRFDLADPARVEALPPFSPLLPPAVTRLLKAGPVHTLLAGEATETGADVRKLLLLSMANPALPQLIGPPISLELSTELRGAAVDGDTLTVLEYNSSSSTSMLRLFTGVEAGLLQAAGTLPLALPGYELVATGGHAYVADSEGLLVVDLVDPAAPTAGKRLPLAMPALLTLSAGRLTVRVFIGAAAVEDRTFSLADPSSPVELSRAPAEWSWLDAPGERPLIYTASTSRCGETCIQDRLELLERGAGQAPLLRGTLDLTRNHWRSQRVVRYSIGGSFIIYSSSSGCVASLCDRFGSLAVIDVRAPSVPALLALDSATQQVLDHTLHGRSIVAAYGEQGIAIYAVPPELP